MIRRNVTHEIAALDVSVLEAGNTAAHETGHVLAQRRLTDPRLAREKNDAPLPALKNSPAAPPQPRDLLPSSDDNLRRHPLNLAQTPSTFRETTATPPTCLLPPSAVCSTAARGSTITQGHPGVKQPVLASPQRRLFHGGAGAAQSAKTAPA